MKNIALPIQFREVIAALLAVSCLVFSLPLRSEGAARSVTDLKTESQYRSEAARYDSAINAISGIGTMKLDTPDELRNALAILDRERPNLKLHRSKLIVMAIGDATFSSGVKKRAPDQKSAEVLVKELNANPRAVLKLDGAESLKTRMQRSLQADATVLSRGAERLKEAAERIKKPSPGSTSTGLGTSNEFQLIRTNFSTGRQPVTTADYPAVLPQVEVAILTIVVALFAATVLIGFAALIGTVIGKLVTVENEEALAQCQRATDEDYSGCVARADREPFPVNIAFRALCGAQWLSRQKDCLLDF